MKLSLDDSNNRLFLTLWIISLAGYSLGTLLQTTRVSAIITGGIAVGLHLTLRRYYRRHRHQTVTGTVGAGIKAMLDEHATGDRVPVMVLAVYARPPQANPDGSRTGVIDTRIMIDVDDLPKAMAAQLLRDAAADLDAQATHPNDPTAHPG